MMRLGALAALLSVLVAGSHAPRATIPAPGSPADPAALRGPPLPPAAPALRATPPRRGVEVST